MRQLGLVLTACLSSCAAAPDPAVDVARPAATPSASARSRPAVLAVVKTELRIDPADTYLEQYAPDCLWAPKKACVLGEHCGPPVPVHVGCPDPAAPPGKEKWFSMPAHFRHQGNACVYEESRVCPPPKLGGGACTVAETLTVSCVSAPGKPGHTLVPAFRYRDGLGRCFQHEGSICADGECEPRVGKLVPC